MIPDPKARPDLYDDYDGLPEGRKSDVTTPPDIQKLIDQRGSGKDKVAPDADADKQGK